MNTDPPSPPDIQTKVAIGEPLAVPQFRRIWLASLFGNFGLLILGVGASWAMTEMTSSPKMVALVQTALMVPIMLLSLAAGAAADMYDRRKVALAAMTLSLTGASLLTLLAALDATTPGILLGGCFLIGSGMALYGPAWQASVSELVPPRLLAVAIALNSISYNIARSLGPAIGGLIVALAGALAAFGAHALLCLPLILAFLGWRRELEPNRLPPERLPHAMMSGIRYIIHSPPIRGVLLRTFLTGLVGGSLTGLMPLVARDLLGGEARMYGLLLGMGGVGAVIGAAALAPLRQRFSTERLIRAGAVLSGLGFVAVALSNDALLTAPVLIVIGAAWMGMITLFNIAVQTVVPRWVAGRALAGYQAAIAGGVALGAWLWGEVAADIGLVLSLLISGVVTAASAQLGRWLPMPHRESAPTIAGVAGEPEVALAINGRSGPVVLEIEYEVDPANARAFYRKMEAIRRIRARNGAYGWSIARDIADPAIWLERFHCPTWNDYLRLRDRQTEAERAMMEEMFEQLVRGDTVRVRRLLERPFGSVRWKDEAPDTGPDTGIAAPVLPPPTTGSV